MNEYTPEKPIWNFFVEFNLRSRKLLLSCSYNPNTNLIADHLHCIGRRIVFCSSKYDNFIVLGDLNTEVSNSFSEQFCSSYNLISLIKEPTCIKTYDNPSGLDPILTNHPKCFQSSGVYEDGIFDFHELTFTVFKTYFQKAKPRIIKYRDHKHFDNNEFRDELIRDLSSNNMQLIITDDLDQCTNISKMILEKKAPLKERYVRYNQVTKLNVWTKTCKKQLWIVPGCWIDIERKKLEATRSACKRQRIFVWNY